MKTALIIFIFLLQALCLSASAMNEAQIEYNNQEYNLTDKEIPTSPENVLYVDLGYLYISSYIILNYERIIADIVAVRIGYGYGAAEKLNNSSYISAGSFALFMIEFLTSHSESKLEIGAGLCLNTVETFENNNSHNGSNSSTNLAFTIGYRNQPHPKGPLFRIGLSVIGFTYGVHVSLGYAF